MTVEEYLQYIEDKKREYKKLYPCILSTKDKIDLIEKLIIETNIYTRNNGNYYICHKLSHELTKFNIDIKKFKNNRFYIIGYNSWCEHPECSKTLEQFLNDIFCNSDFDYGSFSITDTFITIDDSISLMYIALMLPELMDYMPIILERDASYFKSNKERIVALENILKELKLKEIQ